MSVKFLYSSEKTNSFRPTPWHWSTEKFPAYRGNGWRHRGFLAVGKDYLPQFVDTAPSADGYGCARVSFEPSASKIIKTQAKGTLLLVPCLPEQDEQILLITLRGGFRGGYSRIEAIGCEVLSQETSGGHCVVTGHMVVRLTHPNGYVFAETGRRCSTGLVEVFSWDGYKTLPTEEFEVWRTSQAPDTTGAVADLRAQREEDRKAAVARAAQQKADKEAMEKAQAEALAAKVANAAQTKPALLPRLEAVSKRREALGLTTVVLGDVDFYFGGSYRQEYTEENVTKAESEIAETEGKFQRLRGLQERGKALGLTIEYVKDSGWGARVSCGSAGWEFNPQGFDSIEQFLNKKEQEAAEAKAKADAEAAKQARYADAAKLGLPSQVEIWRRRGGRTNAGDGWVIQTDGMPRNPDEMKCPRPRYPGEGTQVWHQILPGEVVLKWAKSCSAAAHEFTVVYQPDQLTDAQRRTIALLQEELEEEWKDAAGLASGRPSPPIGEGWGLLETESADSGSSGPASQTQIDELLRKFGQK